MTLSNESLTCFEVISDLDGALNAVLTPEQQYFVLGGIATAAIVDPNSIFDHENRRLIPTTPIKLPAIRGNGTQRDIDILILDTLGKKQARSIINTVSEAIDHKLVVSVFEDKQQTPPSLKNRSVHSLTEWTSSRTIDAEGKHYYELHPIIQQVPKESYQPWKLELPNNHEVSILSPAGHMLAYYMRSITGVRHKDLEKVELMKHRIEQDPQFKEQIEDGVYNSWKQFAEMIDFMRTNKVSLLHSQYPQTSTAELAIFKKKAKILEFLESNETMVRCAQKGLVQKVLGHLIGSS
jgi:hypothetical protein